MVAFAMFAARAVSLPKTRGVGLWGATLGPLPALGDGLYVADVSDEVLPLSASFVGLGHLYLGPIGPSRHLVVVDGDFAPCAPCILWQKGVSLALVPLAAQGRILEPTPVRVRGRDLDARGFLQADGSRGWLVVLGIGALQGAELWSSVAHLEARDGTDLHRDDFRPLRSHPPRRRVEAPSRRWRGLRSETGPGSFPSTAKVFLQRRELMQSEQRIRELCDGPTFASASAASGGG